MKIRFEVPGEPRGKGRPRFSNRAATRFIAGLLDGVGVSLLTHYVVAPDGFTEIL